jgi:hypothetical protein
MPAASKIIKMITTIIIICLVLKKNTERLFQLFTFLFYTLNTVDNLMMKLVPK